MPKHRFHFARGFSYVEILISVVLLAVIFTAGMTLYGNLGRSGQDTIDQDFAAELCLEMIKEIKALDYADPESPNTGIACEEGGTTRTGYDDIDDYDNWSATPPQSLEGTALSRYAGLTRCVAVEHVSSGNFDQVLSDTNDQGFKRITITIKRDDREITRQIYIIADIPEDMLDPET